MNFSVRIVIAILIVALCAYVGYGLGNYYRRRKKVMTHLVAFSNFVKNEISFTQSLLSEIIDKFTQNSKGDFSDFLQAYKKVLNSDNTQIEHLKLDILKDDEHSSIMQFFLSLGKSDVLTQSNTIDGYLHTFKTYCDDTHLEHKQKASLYQKLGLMFGLAIALIFI